MRYLRKKIEEWKVKAEQKKHVRDYEKLTSVHTYIGLSLENITENMHILNMVLNLVRPSAPARILRAKGGPNLEINKSDNFNEYPCIEITYWCYYKDQYCGGCGSYGCPGGC